MRPLKTLPKFENHFARIIVRFQAQLEADGCFSAQKSSEFAFRCKQNKLSDVTVKSPGGWTPMG